MVHIGTYGNVNIGNKRISLVFYRIFIWRNSIYRNSFYIAPRWVLSAKYHFHEYRVAIHNPNLIIYRRSMYSMALLSLNHLFWDNCRRLFRLSPIIYHLPYCNRQGQWLAKPEILRINIVFSWILIFKWIYTPPCNIAIFPIILQKQSVTNADSANSLHST